MSDISNSNLGVKFEGEQGGEYLVLTSNIGARDNLDKLILKFNFKTDLLMSDPNYHSETDINYFQSYNSGIVTYRFPRIMAPYIRERGTYSKLECEIKGQLYTRRSNEPKVIIPDRTIKTTVFQKLEYYIHIKKINVILIYLLYNKIML